MSLLSQATIHKLQSQPTNPEFNACALVRIYTPEAMATWYIGSMEMDGDTVYGLADLFNGFPELGIISLHELSMYRSPLGLGIIVDENFNSVETLANLQKRLVGDWNNFAHPHP